MPILISNYCRGSSKDDAVRNGLYRFRCQNRAEYASGHIPGAVNIPNETLRLERQQLPDKEQLILVYCRSGNRSKQLVKSW
ncbi:MAG: rhodanese-like domain-containing protein [Acutalibacteraceae bacterium]